LVVYTNTSFTLLKQKTVLKFILGKVNLLNNLKKTLILN